MYFTLPIIPLSGQPKACHVQERIPRLIRLKLELPALLVLSVLASDRNGPGVAIHPSIPQVVPYLSIPLVVPNLSIPLVIPNASLPLIVQMANLMTKGKTMLNSLPVRYPI